MHIEQIRKLRHWKLRAVKLNEKLEPKQSLKLGKDIFNIRTDIVFLLAFNSHHIYIK